MSNKVDLVDVQGFRRSSERLSLPLEHSCILQNYIQLAGGHANVPVEPGELIVLWRTQRKTRRIHVVRKGQYVDTTRLLLQRHQIG